MMTAKFSRITTGTEKVIVLDFYNETATKWYVSLSYDNRGEPRRSASETSLTAEESSDALQVFSTRRNLIDNLEQGTSAYTNHSYLISSSSSGSLLLDASTSENYQTMSSSHTELYSGRFSVRGNPYAFMTNSDFRNGAYSWFVDNYGGGTGQLLAFGDKALSMVDVGITIEIDFYSDAALTLHNGSIEVDIDSNGNTFTPLRGKDGEGNQIPMTRAEVNSENFDFNDPVTEPNFNLFFDYINSHFGSFGGGGGGGDGGCVVTSTKEVGDTIEYTFRC